MTTPKSDPEYFFQHTPDWLQFVPNADGDAWPAEAAVEAWRRAGRTPTDEQLERLTFGLSILTSTLRRVGAPQMAFFYVPDPARSPAAVVEVLVDGLDTQATDDDLVAELTWAVEQQIAAPQVASIETPGGRALRVQQRYVAERNAESGLASEQLIYLWPFRDLGSALVVTTTFQDDELAAFAIPAVDEFVRGLHVQP